MARRLFTPKENGQLRVFVFFSGGASAMKYLLENDSNCGRLYQIVGAFTDNTEASGLKVATSHDISVEILERREGYKGHSPKKQRYYEELLARIAPYDPDLIALSGYMDIVRYPIIEANDKRGKFSNKVLNIHPADLGVMKKSGAGGNTLPVNVLHIPKDTPTGVVQDIKELNGLERAYKGADAVTDALLNGEAYTQSTCHIAQKEADEGPILTQSKKFIVKRDFVRRKLQTRDWRSIVEYAKQLQEQMKWQGDGPAYAKALEVIAQERVSIGPEDFTLFLDGTKLPYCGLQLDS